jgi:2-polyprenyl-3-methyl-5-hydroxy-6-metoxy-1,4-benzoquinol methylase
MMAKKIKGKDYGLEFGLIVLNYLYKSKALHYGYWELDDEVNLWNLGKAQERYTNHLLRHIPPEAKEVLDVGCGTGVVAQRLIAQGRRVECLSPSPFLNAEARRNLPATIVHETTFEDFRTDRMYDLVMFIESFQYVKMDEALPKAVRLIKPGGRILICDVFRLDTPGKSPIGGGQHYSKYLQALEAMGLACARDLDITANIAPTFDLVQDMSLNLMKPAWENALRILAANHPYIFKFVNWKFRKRLKKMNRHFNPERNAKGFREYKTYRIQVLAPKADLDSGRSALRSPEKALALSLP